MTRIAVAQMEPTFGETTANVAASVEAVEKAAAGGAELVVLPELASTGYMFASRKEAYDLGERIGSGPATTAWQQLAGRLGIYLAAGYAERADEGLYNSAALFGPDGLVANYRKVHLWDEEALYFEPGNLAFPVTSTPLGRIGLMICYDGWFPESYRSMSQAGADIICMPTNWVPIPGQAPGQPAMATLLAMANAHSNGVIVAAADRVGTERGQEFIGQSIIVSHTGWPAAGPASTTNTEILFADTDVPAARRSRSWGKFNHVLRDRRPEAYFQQTR